MLSKTNFLHSNRKYFFLNLWQNLSKFHVFFLCNYLARNTLILFYRLLVLKMQCSVRSKPVHMTFERLQVMHPRESPALTFLPTFADCPQSDLSHKKSSSQLSHPFGFLQKFFRFLAGFPPNLTFHTKYPRLPQSDFQNHCKRPAAALLKHKQLISCIFCWSALRANNPIGNQCIACIWTRVCLL